MNEEDASREAGGSCSGAGNREFYRRRLDRSPEKQEFFQLPENDRRLICDLRTAMHSVYEKFTKLREQVDDRETDKTTEPQTTPDLKRQEFVDMYADPAVNEELRQRLLGSRRCDTNMDLSDPTAAFSYTDGFSREKKKRRRSLELEDVELSLQKEKQKRLNVNRRRSIKRTTDSIGATESDDEIASRKTSIEGKIPQQTALGNQIPPSNFPNQGHPGSYFPPYYTWPPTSAVPANGPSQAPFPMTLFPPGYAAASAYPYQFGIMAPVPFVYPASGIHSAAVPHDQEVPVKDTDTAVDAKQAKEHAEAPTKSSPGADAGHDLLLSFAQRPMTDAVGGDAARGVDGAHVSLGSEHCPVCAERYRAVGTGFAETEFAASHRPLLDSHRLTDPMVMMKKQVTSRTFRNFTHSSGGGGGGGEMAESRHSISSRASRLITSSRIVDRPLKGSISQKLDQQISMLLEELEKLKDQNIQLRDELLASEKELDSLRFICQNKDAQIRSQATGKLSIMVQEIYRAQKERDVAMMNRINGANAERDEALLRLKRLQQKYSEATMRQEPSTEEKMLNDVLVRLQSESHSGNIEQKGTEIVEAIRQLKDQRRQIAAEEMRAILEERDLAIAKCRDLQSELSQVRQKVRGEDSSREQRQVLQGKLFAVEHERNLAVEKITKLEDEVLSLRIYYNLHGSLSQEVSLFQQFSKTLDGVEKEMRMKEEEVEVLRIERQQLLEQTKTAVEDKRQMTEEIEKAHNAHKTECSKNEKLQRLVTVLRRKINSLGIKADEPE